MYFARRNRCRPREVRVPLRHTLADVLRPGPYEYELERTSRAAVQRDQHLLEHTREDVLHLQDGVLTTLLLYTGPPL